MIRRPVMRAVPSTFTPRLRGGLSRSGASWPNPQEAEGAHH